MPTVGRNVRFRLSRQRGDRLDAMTVSGGVEVVFGKVEILKGILMLFVLNVGKQLLFHLNQWPVILFFAEVVLTNKGRKLLKISFKRII